MKYLFTRYQLIILEFFKLFIFNFNKKEWTFEVFSF